MAQPANETLAIDLADVGVAALVKGMLDGRIGAEDLARACLDRVTAREPEIHAWAHLDAERVLAQAQRADELRRCGAATGHLHGIPIGIKDIIDTADMPTEDGTVLHQGRQPSHDAAVVSALRAAGAVIMGKTVTAEMATLHPGATRNPWDARRTPGGSSSGSAAAVAAGMVTAALGTQTNGSVIRPASYCGVVGCKPSFGWISRYGVLPVSKSLDTLGVFARSVEDAALVADALLGYDARDPAMQAVPRPALHRAVGQAPPLTPRLAFVKSPAWEQADADTRDGFAELVAELGDVVSEVECSEAYRQVADWHKIVMEAELAVSFAADFARGRDQLSDELVAMIERGRGYSATEYCSALDRRLGVRARLAEVFEEFDAIVTPAATGEAPADLTTTGSPIFCTLWTFAGLPCVSLPLLHGSAGVPMGVQLVGNYADDARLLRTARWLSERLTD